MPSLDLHPNELQLPRPLVNQLLHQAQQATGFSQGFVLRDAHGRYHCAPLPATADLGAAAARACPKLPFAFYRSSSTPLPTLNTKESAALGVCTTLYLGMALDTKGVLQLRAWQIDGPEPIELEVSIHEL